MTINDLPTLIPLYAAQGSVLLPRAQLPLLIDSEEEMAVVDYALQGGQRLIGILQENPVGGHFQKGCVGRITNFQDSIHSFIVVDGLCRFTVDRMIQDEVTTAEVNYRGYEKDLEEETPDDPLINRPRLMGLLKDYLQTQEIAANWDEIDRASDDLILNSLTMACPFGPLEKQALLETSSLSERCDIMIALMEMGHFPFQGPRPVIH